MTRTDSKTTDMTRGSISGQILTFTMPLLLGYICQQLYNTVDAFVVGNFVGEEALAAVSSTASVINLLVGFFMGLSVGAGVVISRRFGEGDSDGVSRAVHTTVAFGVVVSVLLTFVGTLLTPQILVWMGTPDTVLPDSITYFRIYFIGISTVVLYNIGGCLFRAVADSKRPLYYLIVSSVVNVVLDYLFVAGLHQGIEGAAWATVISQAVSAILTFYTLMRVDGPHKVVPRKIRICREELKEIINIGLPSGFQNSIVSFSNVIVQTNINSFGAAAMAGCGTFNRVDGFAGIPISCFMMAAMTFVSQNLGAKEYARARRGARYSILVGVIVAECMGILLFFFTPQVVRLFNQNPEVIAYGALYARNVSLAYGLLALSNVIAGVLRGAGISKLPMFVTIAFWCGLRIVWITTTVPIYHDIRFVFWGYPITWTCTAVVLLIAYLRMDWQHAYERQLSQSAESR